MRKKAFMDNKTLLTGKRDLDLNKRNMKSTIQSILLYAAETWTLYYLTETGFEGWICRKMEQVSCKNNLN